MGYDTENDDYVNYIDYCYMFDAPTCYEDAISGDDAEKREQALDTEIISLESNYTFEVAELPEDKRLVGGKWVYVIKDDDEKCV